MSPAWKHHGRKQKLSLPDGWKIEKKKYRYGTDKFYREESTGKLCRSIPEVKRYLEQNSVANLKPPLDMDGSTSSTAPVESTISCLGRQNLMKPKATSFSDEHISQDNNKSSGGHRNDGQREMVQLESAQEKKPVKKMNKFNLKELPESMDDDYL
uniref:MBD domain-containing protein n=2 Tax=Oryza TaxID=4527 RepID=A0A0D3HC15_9ORYZ